MIGAIIGDIVGSRFEFDNIKRKDFELFTKNCSFTDDTICTVAVADAAMHGKDYGDTLHRWCRRYPTPMGGYGCSFSGWVLSDNPKPYNSFGNGSAMRVSAVGWLFDDLATVLAEAKKSAACTHSHEEGVKGAQAVASAVYMLRKGAGKAQVRAYVTETFCYDLTGTVSSIRKSNRRFDETCQVTVPQAFVCFLESTSFEDAVRNAISIGGDSDTIGAITGALAEAHYGVPADIEARAIGYLDARMRNVLTALKAKTA